MSNFTKFVISKTDTFKELFVIFFSGVSLAAVLYAIFEGKNIFEGLWWAIVTAMTVGYGDTYPHTSGGRLVAAILMGFTVLVIIPLITARIASRFIVNDDAFTNKEQETIKTDLKAIKKHFGVK